jgi:NADPH:quinone reductase-like Zn-dependent oxidoreductase
MKAIIQNGYGSLDALELGEVEMPAPGDGEVLVRVRAASVHPDVWHVVSGEPDPRDGYGRDRRGGGRECDGVSAG